MLRIGKLYYMCPIIIKIYVHIIHNNNFVPKKIRTRHNCRYEFPGNERMHTHTHTLYTFKIYNELITSPHTQNKHVRTMFDIIKCKWTECSNVSIYKVLLLSVWICTVHVEKR